MPRVLLSKSLSRIRLNTNQELDFRNPCPKNSYASRFNSDSLGDKLSLMSNESKRQLVKKKAMKLNERWFHELTNTEGSIQVQTVVCKGNRHWLACARFFCSRGTSGLCSNYASRESHHHVLCQMQVKGECKGSWRGNSPFLAQV